MLDAQTAMTIHTQIFHIVQKHIKSEFMVEGILWHFAGRIKNYMIPTFFLLIDYSLIDHTIESSSCNLSA